MLSNTPTRYGLVSRTLHWAVAVLVLSALILGVIGKNIPRTAENIQLLTTLYSTHKTIGVTVLALAILRIGWALSQPRPVPLHPDRRLETFAAEAAHWVLYAALFVLPLSGWVMHAAEDGFAPIWWPFGQNLPFVPKSESWAMTAGAIHWAAGLLLGVTLAAHIAGALKHKLVDKDATLARMVSSTEAGDPAAQSPHGVTAFAGGAVWVVVLGLTLASIGLPGGTERVASAAAAPTLSEGTDPQSAVWTVQEVDLAFTVVQLGSDVTGHFEALSPSITYDPETGDGQVTVEIDMSSVTLGSVTDQAKGSEFFDVTNHPTAIFEATLTRDDGEAHIADGTLTLTGVSVPVSMPFTLSISDGTAEMTGGVTLDRRDFEIGTSYPDESSVGFSVGVAVTLTASQP